MNRSRNIFKRTLTVGAILILLLAGIINLGACSSDNADDQIEEEKESRKDRKKDKDADGISELKDALKAKMEQESTGSGEEYAKEAVPAKEAFTEYGNRFEKIKGMTANFYTKAVTDGEYGYEYETDTSTVAMGLLGYTISDFDMDGVEELLTYETVDDVTIVFSMYEYDNDVYLSDKYEISDDYLSGDGNDACAFIYGYDGLLRFGYFSDGWMGYYADGEFVSFYGFSYENGKFTEDSKGGYAGSDVWDDEEFLSALRKSGIYCDWEDINEIGLLKAVSGSRLFKIDMSIEDVEYDDNDEYHRPVVLKKKVTFYGSSTLEEVIETEGYFFPNSSYEYLTEADLVGLTNEQLRLARNEIVARHGRRFDDEQLQAYFDSKTWYNGTIAPNDFNTATELNKVERDNMEFIKKHE
ncbi:MAG: YARHG domain-containing protein [Lachnospiraceae bacterium]|nr:YARHG domain-containing protein [Lachnospiraceae bacterium]